MTLGGGGVRSASGEAVLTVRARAAESVGKTWDTGFCKAITEEVGRIKPRSAFVARIPPRARAVVARQWEGRISFKGKENYTT